MNYEITAVHCAIRIQNAFTQNAGSRFDWSYHKFLETKVSVIYECTRYINRIREKQRKRGEREKERGATFFNNPETFAKDVIL